ncbi:DASH family cryptochrome [Olivibacter sp. SDN3]|uniref:DASH family cryptochrome n=1 Tax=Olivibacter sp. SDN3 TaxID=2764720 RepID=UPI0016518979|nr:DASH family cryptochrome [Olivibacter sp. SDN3]QNL51471.1 DASH family cryptochrome [Olivibacter sp. SDN3]
MNKDTILVWFRNDLRVRDNEILWQAIERADKVVPVYIFDPRNFGYLTNGLQKTGVLRAKFILESVSDLRTSLRARGGDLLVTTGHPEELLPDLATQYDVKEVYHHREVAEEETNISTLVEEALWRKRLNLKHFIGHTLYHKEDLPFPIKDIPDAFSTFRKKIERETAIRPSLGVPETITLPDDFVSDDELPSLRDLGFGDAEMALARQSAFTGGESAAIEQLQAVIAEEPCALSEKMGADNGTILSPWIAMGCLSAHTVYHTVKRYEDQRLSKKTASTIIQGLLWRDYFRFMFKKYGNRFFTTNGFSATPINRSPEQTPAFEAWKKGETGNDLVDAAMRQLNEVGFMPHAARALVAHYLVEDLGLSHLLGAAYFEDKLIDYGPSSNYGNWAHIAGAGSSLKDNGIKDVKKMQAAFDPKGDYVKRWLFKQKTPVS